MTTPAGHASRPDFASFWHDLPREGKLLLSVVVLEFLGTGLVLPFHVVYLHEVRGFALDDVGLLLALSSLAGFLAAGPAGTLIDRLGACVVLLSSLVLLVAGNLGLAVASTSDVAAVALALSGMAFGVSWPSSQSLVAAVVPPHLRQRYFGVNFTLLNLGIGLGGVLGGVFVDVDRLGAFRRSTSLTPPATSRPCFSSWSRCAASRAGPGATRPRSSQDGLDHRDPDPDSDCDAAAAGRLTPSVWTNS